MLKIPLDREFECKRLVSTLVAPKGAVLARHRQGTTSLCLLSLWSWLDVVILTKEVGRIILVLQRNQSVVSRPISGAGVGVAFVFEVIHIRPRGHERLHGVREGAGPGQVFLRIFRVRPNRKNREIVRVPAMRERRLCRTNARGGSVQVLSWEPDKCLPRRGLRSEVYKGVDGFVADGLEEVRFPVVQLARREETVEHRLHLIS